MDAFTILERIPEADRDSAVTKFRDAETVDQVMAIAQDLDVQVTAEEAAGLLHAMGSCDISLEDLDMVSGGCDRPVPGICSAN